MRKPIELDEQEYCLLVKRRDGPLYTSEQDRAIGIGEE